MGVGPAADRAIRGVAAACRDAGDEQELLASVGTRVRAAVPHSAAAWLVTDPASGMFTTGHVERFDREVCAPWFHNELHVDDLHKFHDLVGAGPAVLSRTGRRADSSRWETLMRPYGFDDEVRFTLDDHSGCWGTVELHRDVGDPPFSPAEAGLLDRVRPVVAAALRRLALRREAAGAADPDGPGLVHVHLDGTTEAATRAGAAWLEVLLPPDRPDVRTGLTVLASAVLGATVRDGPRRLRRRTADGRWVSLHAAEMLTDDTVAVIIEPSRPAEIADVLARAHELTPRERQVALAIARGAGTHDMAAAFHISPHTVRDHVKSALAKADVGSRAELVAALFDRHYAPRFFDRVEIRDD